MSDAFDTHPVRIIFDPNIFSYAVVMSLMFFTLSKSIFTLLVEYKVRDVCGLVVKVPKPNRPGISARPVELKELWLFQQQNIEL